MNYTLTRHAIERYIERVKPALNERAAEKELSILVDAAGEAGPKPTWLYLPPEVTQAADLYLTLSDGIAAPVAGALVLSVITRGGSNPTHRANKNKSRAKRRAARKKPAFKPGRGREAGIRWH